MEERELTTYSIDQVKFNDGISGKPLWIIIKREVYDVSNFNHPGGKAVLLDSHGEDRYEEFQCIHSKIAKQESLNYRIGKLEQDNKEN